MNWAGFCGDEAYPKAIKLLVSGQTPQTTVADGRVNLRVDSVLDHEVVAVDF